MLPIQPDLYRSFSSMKQQRVIYYSPLDEYQPLQGYPPRTHLNSWVERVLTKNTTQWPLQVKGMFKNLLFFYAKTIANIINDVD